MSNLLYEVFFRKYAIRNPNHILAPIVTTLDKFVFPKNAIHHFVVNDSVNNGPPSDEYLYRDISRKIPVYHVLSLTDTKGMPKRLSVPIVPYVREYHMKHKRFRFMDNETAITTDENFLVVINYGFAAKSYRYVRSLFTEYYKWWNLQKTVWDTIREKTQQSERQHFVMMSLPKVIPAPSRLNAELNQQSLKIFNTPEALFIHELWNWIGTEKRADSVIGTMSQSTLDKVNLVIQESGHFVVLNLGLLNKWRLDPDATIEDQKIKISAKELQKRVLRLFMTLTELRNTVGDEVAEGEILDNVEKVTTDDVSDDELSKADKMLKVLSTIDDDLEILEILDKQRSVVEEAEPTEGASTYSDKQIDKSFFNNDKTPEEVINQICDNLADVGVISASEFKKYTRLADQYKTLTAPDGKSTLGEYVNINPEELKITSSYKMTDIPTVLDKTMLSSSLIDFDERYIKTILSKDVAGMVVNAQKAGFTISRYEVETIEDVLGAYDAYTIRLNPIEGMPSTIRFKLPVVNEDGVYTRNGVKYRMRKQRGDLPLRKTAPERVALTSYYGKTFVTRSDKKVNDYGNWLREEILRKGINQEDNSILNLYPANVFNNLQNAPKVYTTIAQSVKSFTSNGFNFIFDHSERVKLFSEEQIAKYEKNGNVLVGYNALDEVIFLDDNGIAYKGSNIADPIPLGSLESYIGINTQNAPIDFSQVKIYGKNIPVGIILAYKYGLTNLMKALKANVRTVAAGQRLNLQEHEYSLSFSDETLILSKDDTLATIILAGFKEYQKSIKNYSVLTFDKPNVYLNILESNSISARYLREVDLMDNLFVDPITKDLLVEMKEPTSFRELLIRSSELLLKDTHPDALDMEYMRIKGYERFAGAVYSEMVTSVREHKSKGGRASAAIEMNPYAVWMRITSDPSINQVSDINPIENLKQQEAVTYSGVGGRMGRSMTKNSRSYHRNDMGVISEATSDSSDVAINTFTSADPQFKSLRGTANKYEIGVTGATALLSTSALISVGSENDDPKRVNFSSIQHSHGLACSGYRQSSVRTGYEQILAQRTSDLFAFAARADGKVVSKKDKGIVIQYENGERKSIEIGRRFGSAAGLTIAHSVVTDLKEGDAFKKGDIISYNDGYFERDILNPKNVVWKMGVTVKTVLYESPQTHEDASSISSRLANQLSTKITKVKDVLVTFDQQVRDIITAGTVVNHETILCIIEDAITSNSNLFDIESLNTLRLLSNQAPSAKMKGVLEKIEVFYHGEKEDMSPTLQALANAGDRELAIRNRALQKHIFTGSVREDFRIDGTPLGLDCMAIRFYITTEIPSGIGDKGVFCNQMKTIFSEVMDYTMTTETGKVIDAVFGQKSIDDRIVNSAIIIGTTNSLLDVIGKKAVEVYKGK